MPKREHGFNTYRLHFVGEIRYDYLSWGDIREERWRVEREVISFGRDVAEAMVRAQDYYVGKVKSSSFRSPKDIRFENVNILNAALISNLEIAYPELGYQCN